MRRFQQTVATIESELRAIRNGAHRPGIQIGRLLIRVERSEYWRKEGASGFTDWMEKHAQDFGVKKTMIWTNYRGALIYQDEIRPKLLSWGLEAPLLEDLTSVVSTENLDYLHRIALAAPEAVVRPLTVRVIEGTVSRAELRKMWHAYRGVVKCDPHRKGRIKTKSFAGINKAKLFEAAALDALGRDQRWASGEGAIDLFEIVREPKVQFPGSNTLDALLLMKKSGCMLEIHGLYVKTAINDRVDTLIQNLAPYVDRQWIITPQGCDHRRIPRYVGIVEMNGAVVHLVRPASPAATLGGRVLDLTRDLLVVAHK